MRKTHSKGIRLLAAGFTLRLPTDTPYDRQLLGEHVSALLKRHGAVRLSSGRRAWWLTLAAFGKSGHCGRCLRPSEGAVQLGDGDVVCVACASRAVILSQVDNERSAA